MTGTQFLHSLLDQVASLSPQRPAIRTDTTEMSYGELSSQTCRAASWLSTAGICRGDRVLIVLPNGLPLVTLIVAASRIGAIFCVVNPSVKTVQLRHILEDAQPSIVLTTVAKADELAENSRCPVFDVEAVWPDILGAPVLCQSAAAISQDIACLIYTSGSTALPKAVVSTHRNILFATAAIQNRLGLRQTDVIATVIPLSFDYGLYQFFLTLHAGATIALGNATEAGPQLLPALRRWNATVLPIVPSLGLSLTELVRRDRKNLPPLRMITNTGAKLHASTITRLQNLFPDAQIFVMFGLTECKRTSILDPSDYARKPDSVGRPLPDTECLIIGPDGKVLPAGEIGELVVRGPHVMSGYWRAPELTANRFRRWGSGSEYALFTGDSCHIDADGYLYFHGRNDDIYKQSGFRVSAIEVEAAAYAVDGVEHAAVLPPKDDEAATLIVSGLISETSVLIGLQKRLEDFKIPSRILVAPNMPLSVNGKIDKHELRRSVMESAS
ncbi:MULTISPECIES: class I adenylate-forming enzyme family protein [unclassified Bradyrhizobium]|uniref:class I adenylate-forming enzyme family protein n=1 Tax=unclassified Bradyrhizobium TaxID=2631580 RepID=UPI002917108D|nr:MULTISPECIES: AMP-binding protein [unclassified Bradyrhizobium]